MSNEPLALLSPELSVRIGDNVPKRARPVSAFASTFGFSVSQKAGMVLAVDSTECFVLAASQVDLSDFKSEETLAIALEEQLPLDAEDMVVGTVKSKSKDALTIVCERTALVAEVERLESEQHWIAAVSTTCLLAVQELTMDAAVPASFDCLWKNPLNGWDLVLVRKARPVGWQWVDEKDLFECCADDSASGGSAMEGNDAMSAFPLIVQGELPEQMVWLLRESREITHENVEAQQIDFAKRMAARIVRGEAVPWLDLAGKRLPTREPWAPIRIPLLILLGLLCMSLLAFQGLLLWQSTGLAASAMQSDDEQIAAFRVLYPGQKIPTDVVGLLKSELRRLQASEEEMQKEPPVYSALPVLAQFLNGLPQEATFRIDRVQAKSNEIVSAEGATRTLEDFQSLISSIRQAGFEFQQPNVVSMADGFTLRLERLTHKPRKEKP